MPFVYLLRCRDDSLYAGATKDLAARLREHQLGKASRYTRSRLPLKLVWSRRVATWSQALREERRIKRLTRLEKQTLASQNRRRQASAAARVARRGARQA